MCGIAGLLGPPSGRNEAEMTALATSMANVLDHRGPDASGAWVDPAAGVALGHRRLAVIDLSSWGNQPMASSCGRIVVVFNGEIYNHRDLARDLAAEGRSPRGHSDTEALVEALAAWGTDATLSRLNGMFAFAAWDRSRRVLALARDRMGEKPLYYGRAGTDFVFGSELKALRRHPDFAADIDRGALASFLRFRYVPAPHTILREVRKLEPGHVLRVAFDERRDRITETDTMYWSVREAAIAGMARRADVMPEHELIDEADSRLRAAVGLRMEADVGLGSFLSGGIDSSTVTALMQAQSSGPVRTFTVGYDDPAWDESASAAQIAETLGTDHTDLRVTPAEALDVIPEIADTYDEPFADSSQIPSMLVSRLTRRHVTVALSGDGGDELFGGYNRYLWAPRLLATSAHLPRRVRSMAGQALASRSPAQWGRAYAHVEAFMPRRWRQRMPGDKIGKLAQALQAGDAQELYVDLVSHWKCPESVVVGGTEVARPTFDAGPLGAVDAMTLADMAAYLPGDILTKVDRASMASSLEARAPLLDHHLVEWSWTLPADAKIRAGRGKWLLRSVLARYVPATLWERPKMGFGVPIGDWLRGPLRDWAETLLDPAVLRADGYLQSEPISAAWQQHISGRANRQYELWDVLMFQSWLRRWSR